MADVSRNRGWCGLYWRNARTAAVTRRDSSAVHGSRVMTLYMLFAGLGILIYAGVALAEAAVSGLRSAHIAFGLQFAFLASRPGLPRHLRHR